MPRHDYIFVDESGDPGFTLDKETGLLLSSAYYVAAALHVCDDAFRELNRHVAAFRYLSGLNGELKIPAGRDEFTRLLDPIRALAEGGSNVWGSVVYVNKRNYTGSYLKPGGSRPANPVRFRNYMLRRLLEHHFARQPLQSEHYDLILDRIDSNRREKENLWRYIANNRHIPTPTNMTHASSIYVEGLQIVHHLANGFRDVVGGSRTASELAFVNARDLTFNQYVYG